MQATTRRVAPYSQSWLHGKNIICTRSEWSRDLIWCGRFRAVLMEGILLAQTKSPLNPANTRSEISSVYISKCDIEGHRLPSPLEIHVTRVVTWCRLPVTEATSRLTPFEQIKSPCPSSFYGTALPCRFT